MNPKLIEPQKIFEDPETKKKVVLVCPFDDNQTGLYIRNAFVNRKCPVAPIDWRELLKVGQDFMNHQIIQTCKNLEKEAGKPDLILIIKGLGITGETVNELKQIAPVAFWIFDTTLGGKILTECYDYLNVVKEADYFFTVVRGQIKELKNLGINAYWLPEACDPYYHRQLPINWYEQQKFGADASFCGTIGAKGYHEDRLLFLNVLGSHRINLKIYGDIIVPELVNQDLMNLHTKLKTVNEQHSIVVAATKINLGHSGWKDIDMSFSARVYRVLAAGGFYLTNRVKGTEDMFKDKQHLVMYDSYLDCVQKIKYYLEHPEEREQIGKAGQKLVLEKHTFEIRIEQMLGIIFNANNKKNNG